MLFPKKRNHKFGTGEASMPHKLQKRSEQNLGTYSNICIDITVLNNVRLTS
jgi:hypothetical protein